MFCDFIENNKVFDRSCFKNFNSSATHAQSNLKFKFKILIPIPTWNRKGNSRQRKYNLKISWRYHLPLHCPCPFTSPFSIVTLKIQIKFRLDSKKNRIAFSYVYAAPFAMFVYTKRKFFLCQFLLKQFSWCRILQWIFFLNVT